MKNINVAGKALAILFALILAGCASQDTSTGSGETDADAERRAAPIAAWIRSNPTAPPPAETTRSNCSAPGADGGLATRPV